MLNLKHGGHLLPGNAESAKELARKVDGVRLAKGPLPATTPFGYLLSALTKKSGSRLPGDRSKVVADLNALATAMVDDRPPRSTGSQPSFNSTIPGIYTYWGQFIDHDLTANTDRDSTVSDITSPTLEPIPPDEVTQKLKNLRRPTLDLDSLYGDGPSFTGNTGLDAALYDGPRFRLGTCHTDGVPGERTLPRKTFRGTCLVSEPSSTKMSSRRPTCRNTSETMRVFPPGPSSATGATDPSLRVHGALRLHRRLSSRPGRPVQERAEPLRGPGPAPAVQVDPRSRSLHFWPSAWPMACLHWPPSMQRRRPVMDAPYQAAPDVHVLPTHVVLPGMGMLPVNAYVLLAEEPVLIDTGMGPDVDDVVAALSSIIDPRALRWVWLTHDDAHHTGAIRRVFELAPHARLVTHAFSAMRMSSWWPVPFDRVHAIRVGGRLPVGARTLRAVAAPLYDNPMSTGLLDEGTGSLFAVDSLKALLPETTDDAAEVPHNALAGATAKESDGR